MLKEYIGRKRKKDARYFAVKYIRDCQEGQSYYCMTADHLSISMLEKKAEDSIYLEQLYVFWDEDSVITDVYTETSILGFVVMKAGRDVFTAEEKALAEKKAEELLEMIVQDGEEIPEGYDHDILHIRSVLEEASQDPELRKKIDRAMALAHAEDARRMKQKGYPVEDIMEVTGLSVPEIKKL